MNTIEPSRVFSIHDEANIQLAAAYDCQLNKRFPAVKPIWQEMLALLQELSERGEPFTYLRSIGSNSLTSMLFGELANVQEVFLDGSIGLKVGQRSRCIIPFQVETMPPVANRLNEDAFFIEKTEAGDQLVVGIIDGATSQKPIEAIQPASGAFHLSHLVSFSFSRSDVWQQLARRPELTALALVESMNHWLKEQLETVKGVSYADVLTIPGAAATFVTINPTTQEGTFAHIADTMLAVEKADGEVMILTDNKNEPFDQETGELIEAIAAECGMSYINAAKDARVKAQLAASFLKKINSPTGCGILNGMPELFTNNLVQSGTFSLKGVRRLLLLSDGAYAPWQQMLPTDAVLPQELGSMIDQAREGGHTPLSITGRLLQTDPDAVKYRRLKPQDDATVLTIDLV